MTCAHTISILSPHTCPSRSPSSPTRRTRPNHIYKLCVTFFYVISYYYVTLSITRIAMRFIHSSLFLSRVHVGLAQCRLDSSKLGSDSSSSFFFWTWVPLGFVSVFGFFFNKVIVRGGSDEPERDRDLGRRGLRSLLREGGNLRWKVATYRNIRITVLENFTENSPHSQPASGSRCVLAIFPTYGPMHHLRSNNFRPLISDATTGDTRAFYKDVT